MDEFDGPLISRLDQSELSSVASTTSTRSRAESVVSAGRTSESDESDEFDKTRKKFKLSDLPTSWLPRQQGISRVLMENFRDAMLDRDFAVALELLKGRKNSMFYN